MMNDLSFEAAYWGDCTNTFDEEQKHYVYARFMELKRKGYAFITENKNVLDIGGGPVSMLLKCVHLGPASTVTDPLMRKYPKWVRDRYDSKRVHAWDSGGEVLGSTNLYGPFDEVWIYNCLQHVEDPAKIIENAKALAPVLRIFEWINIPPHEGHPHMLTREKLDEWIGQRGQVVDLNGESGCFGEAYYGVFTHAR